MEKPSHPTGAYYTRCRGFYIFTPDTPLSDFQKNVANALHTANLWRKKVKTARLELYISYRKALKGAFAETARGGDRSEQTIPGLRVVRLNAAIPAGLYQAHLFEVTKLLVGNPPVDWGASRKTFLVRAKNGTIWDARSLSEYQLWKELRIIPSCWKNPPSDGEG